MVASGPAERICVMGDLRLVIGAGIARWMSAACYCQARQLQPGRPDVTVRLSTKASRLETCQCQ